MGNQPLENWVVSMKAAEHLKDVSERNMGQESWFRGFSMNQNPRVFSVSRYPFFPPREAVLVSSVSTTPQEKAPSLRAPGAGPLRQPAAMRGALAASLASRGAACGLRPLEGLLLLFFSRCATKMSLKCGNQRAGGAWGVPNNFPSQVARQVGARAGFGVPP